MTIITSIIAYGVTGQVGAALMIGGIEFYRIFCLLFSSANIAFSAQIKALYERLCREREA